MIGPFLTSLRWPKDPKMKILKKIKTRSPGVHSIYKGAKFQHDCAFFFRAKRVSRAQKWRFWKKKRKYNIRYLSNLQLCQISTWFLTSLDCLEVLTQKLQHKQKNEGTLSPLYILLSYETLRLLRRQKQNYSPEKNRRTKVTKFFGCLSVEIDR